ATHVFGGTDKGAFAAEPVLAFSPEALEKLDVLCLFAGELEKSPHAVVVSGELRPRMIHYVRENKLLDKTEHGEILVPPNLVQSQLFFRGEKRKLLHLGQGLRHERFTEVELLVATNDVVHFPANSLRGCEGRLGVISRLLFL